MWKWRSLHVLRLVFTSDGVGVGVSLPAEVLWGSFVTHSFLPLLRMREVLWKSKIGVMSVTESESEESERFHFFRLRLRLRRLRSAYDLVKIRLSESEAEAEG